jgi:DNA-binding SARP family transcriptional activator
MGETYSWRPVLERQVRDLRLTSLHRALRLASRDSSHELALEIAECILTLDALDEPTVALTMRFYLARGDSASAAATYRAFRLTLARRYSSAAPSLAQPSHELLALFTQAVGKDVAAREPTPAEHPAEPPPRRAQAPPR